MASLPEFPQRNSLTCSLSIVSSVTLDYGFNVLRVGNVFKTTAPALVTGSEDGVLRVLKVLVNETSKNISGIEMTGSKLETKAGPIQAICLENLTNFNAVDVVVGDSKGMLTILTNNQILSRRGLLQDSILSIAIEKDSAGNMRILLGCLDGTILAVSPYSTLWKVRLSDVLLCKQMKNTSTEITCLHSLRITSGAVDAAYTLIADNNNCVHWFQNGTLVRSSHLPSPVICMCTGYFIALDSTSTPVPSTPVPSTPGFSSPSRKPRLQARADDQVAVGTRDGRIFIIIGQNIIQYGQIGTRITNIRSVKGSYDGCDLVICCGHFNFVSIFQDGNELKRHPTQDWVHTFDILNYQDSNKYLFLGCLDNKVEILKLDF